MKRLSSVFLFVIMLLCTFTLVASAETKYCTDLTGTNIFEGQFYYTQNTTTIRSHLTSTASGNLMTVTYSNGAIKVFYYTKDYKLTKTVNLKEELPIFGGFYETEDNYYILSGQDNPDEDPEVEVFRVTKYDKNWKRQGSVGLYDCNTTIPFIAGTARFAHSGNTLVIRTCHQMYKYHDGLNHQANLTFSVNTDTMTVTYSVHGVSNIHDNGYVSHSFNQFIRYDDRFVAVDLGDAYPRAVCLAEYGTDAFLSYGPYIARAGNLIDIPGEIGDNYTGIDVGGFEISPTTYIVAGSSRGRYCVNYNSPHNIFVSTVSRESGEVKNTYLTAYETYENAISSPHLVKVSDDYFMLLWGEADDEVHYIRLNGKGEQQGKTQTMKGKVSDCEPVVIDKKIQWYSYNGNDITFYSINTEKTGSTSSVTVNNGHKFTAKNNDTHHWEECTNCKSVSNKTAHGPTSENAVCDFDEKGNWITYCRNCKRVLKTEKVTFQLKYKKSKGEEIFTPVLKTASKTLSADKDYSAWKSYHMYDYTNNGTTETKLITYAFYSNSGNSNSYTKTFTSLTAYDNGKIADIKPQKYTGKAVKPSVKVTADGKTLKKDKDYTVSYTNNTKAGTAKVTVTGTGAYFGTLTKKFRISPSIESAKVTGIKTKTYTGKKIKQSVKVVLNGKTLKKGTDYTLSYKNNTKAGTATLIIEGSGNYAGTITKSFKIKAADVSKCKIKLSDKAYTYNGKAKKPSVIVKGIDGKELKNKTDYTVTYPKSRKDVGTYKVTVKMKGNYSGSKKLSFTIKPAKTSVKKLTAGKKQITVAIEKEYPQVTGYEIQYSTSKKFKKAKTKKLSDYKTTKCTIKKLSAKETYYVRVRTYKAVGKTNYFSEWSKIKSIKTK